MARAKKRRTPRERSARYPTVLLALLVLEFAVLAVSPVSRSTWLLENTPVLLLVAVLVATYRSFRFSRVSYTLIFVFLAFHEIGAHYTYAEVPYDAFFRRTFGFSLDALLGFERNQFDRAIHFAYGLLFAYPIREVFLRVVAVRGLWGYVLPLDLTMSTSMIYELIEWAVWEGTTALTGEPAQAYLGTQGDEWDAHKDMALASLGALIAMTVTLGINRALQRDFAAEWADSLRVKDPEPLGEEALARMIDGAES